MYMKSFHFLLIGLIVAASAPATTNIRDIVSIEGVRDNQLLGYGLVVGLKGTGDRQQTLFSAQSLANVLQRMGVTVSATLITVKNTAAVMVTGTLPPFAEPGMKIDITASSIGDAATLQGGLLIMTSLRAADGQVYAVAQGPVITGGFVAGGGAGNSRAVNHPTVGRIPEGALIERPAPSIVPKTSVRLQLHQLDFGTASLVAEAINRKFSESGSQLAHAENGSIITVAVPREYTGRTVEFVAAMGRLSVEPERRSKIVVNERTGTIVMGKDVHVAPVAILHGDLTIEVQTALVVSQPGILSQGTTQVIPQVKVVAQEEKAKNVILKEGATIEDLVRGLNSIGSTPRDIIAILEDLRAAGALDAELEVI
jgi:flagellar P-ring protein precursor FlgI